MERTQEENEPKYKQKSRFQEYIMLKHQSKKATRKLQEKEYYYDHGQMMGYVKKYSDKLLCQPSANPLKSEQLRGFLLTGNNICFYGLGSKIRLLEKLAEDVFSDCYQFIINGYIPNVTERTILVKFYSLVCSITKTAKKDRLKGSQIVNQIQGVLQHRPQIKIAIVFHNIDGQHLSTPETQLTLSRIFNLKSVQVLASMDNVTLMMRWNYNILSNYRFIFWHVATGEMYHQELKYLLQKGQKGQKLQQSLKYIWKSLTKIQKDILKILAKNELEHQTNSQVIRFDFSSLLEECRNNIVLSNEVQLRDNLLEILDHKVVDDEVVTQNNKNRRVYIMKYDRRVLENIISDAYQDKK